MKKILFLSLLASFYSQAQIEKYWTYSNTSIDKIQKDRAVTRVEYPKEYKLFSLKINLLREELFSIVGNTARKQSTTIELPNADGQIEKFEIFEASNFDTTLQARFPEIRAYSGKGITDKYATLKLSLSPAGITSSVFRIDEKSTEFIEAYSQDHTIYSVYKSQRDKSKSKFKCSTPEEFLVDKLKNTSEKNTIQKANNGQLRILRLALSCNAEYANYFGATSSSQVGLVLAAFNNTLTRCNGIYERDFGLHLNLINETTNVIYYNSFTDPYTTDNGFGGASSTWSTELQKTLNTSLTGLGTSLSSNNSAYDIGHMFGKIGGANAGCIGCVCVDGITSGSGNTKGRGNSASYDGIPQGDNFDIDVVVHEIAHQLGANHTFTYMGEGVQLISGSNPQFACKDNQVEVGSGITIMGYAGVTNADLTNHSIDKFHAATIAQIESLFTGTLGFCGTSINISARNATPNVVTNATFTIPANTSFALDCTGSDSNLEDTLTYSWEQMDSPLSNLTCIGNNISSSATSTKVAGPNFLSWQDTSSSLRYFPIMSSIMLNSPVTEQVNGDTGMQSEALLSIGRTLNFRVTVRDNSPYVSTTGLESVSQNNFADMAVTIDPSVSPLIVTSQGVSGTSYTGANSVLVTWSGGSTNRAKTANSTNVDILITYDNGVNWSTVISGTPNDGSETIVLPNPSTTQNNCRIMVRSAVTATQKSFYFDVNDNSFTIINNPLGSDNFDLQAFEMYPNPTIGNFTIKFIPQNKNVNIKVYDVRGREIFEKEYTSDVVFNQNISLNNAQTGIYLVSISDGNNKTVKRIIIE